MKPTNFSSRFYPVFFISMLLLTTACTGNKLFVKIIANSLTSAGDSTVFTGDDDPEIIAQSLPLILKIYESLLATIPDDPPLNLAAGSGFIMYANAFVHTPSKFLPDSEFEKKNAMIQRAKKLYLRGRKYALIGLDSRYPGFKKMLDQNTYGQTLAAMKKEDVPYLYWAGASWMGAYSCDPFDSDIGATISKAIALMNRAIKLDDSYSFGAIHDFFISYYGALPAVMGGSEEKARYHFKKALEYGGGYKASPYVALATSVSIKNQNAAEFTGLLNKALAIDIHVKPTFRLANVLAQQEARWYLDHIDDKILSSSKHGGK